MCNNGVRSLRHVHTACVDTAEKSETCPSSADTRYHAKQSPIHGVWMGMKRTQMNGHNNHARDNRTILLHSTIVQEHNS